MNTTLTVEQALQLYTASQKETGKARAAEDAALALLASAAGSKTFNHNNQWYQVRTRPSGAYLCKLKCSPKQKWAAVKARDVAQQLEQEDQPELTQELVAAPGVTPEEEDDVDLAAFADVLESMLDEEEADVPEGGTIDTASLFNLVLLK